MNKWLLTNKPVSFADQFDSYIKLYDGYHLFFSLSEDKFFYDVEKKSGIFIFGYYTTRLDININYINLDRLFLKLINNPYKSHEIIKGIYTIVLIQKGRFFIFNDPLGISKFYYSLKAEYSVFSGRIKYVRQISETALSKNQILSYYIFNYCLNGNTFFNEIQYSIPGSISFIDENGLLKVDQYFDILLHMSEQKNKLSKEELFIYAPTLWLRIIAQWQGTLNNKKASLTLTAGLDSRVLLGSFMRTGYCNYDTFTFGRPESLDVVYSNKLAKEYDIPHKHLYPGEDFFTYFDNYAREVYEHGDTLVSIYRAHRLEAYNEVMNDANAIVMGLAGSDLVRGYGYDGLIVSPITYSCWNKKSFESYFNDPHIIHRYQNLGFNSFEYLLDRKSDFDYLSHNLRYLFKVVIPLHFSQDITLNSNKGYITLVPFLDLDYLEFLRKNPYFGIYNYHNFRIMDIIRRTRGLYYSSYLSHCIYKELSEFGIGKGISPKMIIKSPIWSLIKGYLRKISKADKHYVANFNYGEWFWKYLYRYIKMNNLDKTGLNKDFLLQELNKIDKKGGELHFLDFVKAINIHMATNL